MTARDSLKRLGVLMGAVFIDMVGFSMVLTQFPFYAERYGATPSLIGLLISAFAVAQLSTAPLWGRFSDHYGRRPAILAGLLSSAVAFLLFGFAPYVTDLGFSRDAALWVLLFSRLAQGAGGGTIGVIQAYVSDSSAPGERAKILGWVTAATSAGVMIGPTLGSLTFHFGPEAPGLVAAGLCLANLLFARRWLPESHPKRDGDPTRVRTPLLKAVATVLARPTMTVNSLILIYAAGMLAFMSLNGVLVLYLERVFDFTETTIGWFYLYVAGISFVMRAFLLGPIVRLFGETNTMRVGAATIGIGMLTIPLADDLIGLAAVALFIPIGTSLLFPATTSMVSQFSRKNETGQTLGVQQAFGGLARWFGPIWSTIVFEHLGIATPFWIAGALMGVVVLFALRVDGRRGLPLAEDEEGAESAPAAAGEVRAEVSAEVRAEVRERTAES